MKKPSPIIITVPNPKLFEVAKPVTSFDDDLKKQIDLMIKTLRSQDGVGLAAPQLGYQNRVFVVEYQGKDEKNNLPLQIFINPQLLEPSDEEVEMIEGCLSVPKIELPLIRPEKIKIKAQNQNGKKIKLTAKGLLARVIQHENDHLFGKIFTEKVRDKFHQKNPNIKNLKIVFIGSGIFAEQVLRGLILLDLNILQIITEQGKPVGRKQKICPTPVAQTAKLLNKNLIETANIKEDVAEIKKTNPDLIILADFGQILPQNILDIAKITAINLHPSLLPKFRGASPIASAILSGDKETGLSIIKMSAKVDQGELLAQEAIEISPDDNTQSLRYLLANVALKMLLECLPQLQKGEFKAILQDETQATFTHKFKKEDGEINWSDDVEKIDRQIRAFFPWPGSYTQIDDRRLIIRQAHLEGGKLALDIVQPEGKNPMSWQDFLRGFRGKKPVWFQKISLDASTGSAST